MSSLAGQQYLQPSMLELWQLQVPSPQSMVDAHLWAFPAEFSKGIPLLGQSSERKSPSQLKLTTVSTIFCSNTYIYKPNALSLKVIILKKDVKKLFNYHCYSAWQDSSIWSLQSLYRYSLQNCHTPTAECPYKLWVCHSPSKASFCLDKVL